MTQTNTTTAPLPWLLAAHRLAQVTWPQPKAAKDEPPMGMRERAIWEMLTARDKPRRVIPGIDYIH